MAETASNAMEQILDNRRSGLASLTDIWQRHRHHRAMETMQGKNRQQTKQLTKGWPWCTWMWAGGQWVFQHRKSLEGSPSPKGSDARPRELLADPSIDAISSEVQEFRGLNRRQTKSLQELCGGPGGTIVATWIPCQDQQISHEA
jgi:hypothetical protein